MLPSRLTAIASAGALAAGLLLVPTPADAAVALRLEPSLTAYTDSRLPQQSFAVPAEEDVPVGAWTGADRRKHVSRAYVSFDLARYAGRPITEALLQLTDRGDCDHTRRVEVWRVAATSAAPTWATAPRSLTRVGALPATGGCPSGALEVDVTAALRAAQQAGERTATLMFRVPGAREESLAAGRRIVVHEAWVRYTGAPEVPENRQVSGVACTDDGIAVGTTRPVLRAFVDDADFGVVAGERVTATFAYWPVDRPADRVETDDTELTSAGWAWIDTELADGGTYAWTVRATDASGARSDWAPECRFTVDTVRPKPPVVTSADYPATGQHGGPGISGRFTFTTTDADAVKFRWSAYGAGIHEVPVGPGGTATVEYTPRNFGMEILTVLVIDRTGNRSGETQYEFSVRNTEPDVVDHDPEAPFGAPHRITLAPGMPDVVEYTYWIGEDGERTTVRAGADGTASIVVTPDRPGYTYLYVTSRTAAGLPSGTAMRSFHLASAPTVTSDIPAGTEPLVGTEVAVTFHPGMPGVTEYVWWTVDDQMHVVPAGADGTATVRITQRDWPYLFVTAYSRTAAGVTSESASGGWALTAHNPEVSSAEYPEQQTSGGPGTAGTFTFRPAQPGVTAYTYAFDEGTPRTVPAAADGTATITWTPDAGQAGWHTLQVREHIGDLVSNPTDYMFAVAQPQ